MESEVELNDIIQEMRKLTNDEFEVAIFLAD